MKYLKIVCVLALAICAAVFLYAEEVKRTAEIAKLDGTAEVKPAGQSVWSAAKVGVVLNEGDTLKTAANSSAVINVDGNGQAAVVEVSEKSQLLLSSMMADQKAGTSKTLLDLAMGEVLIKAQKIRGEQSKFEVKTPTSIVGVRGTTFKVKVEAIEE